MNVFAEDITEIGLHKFLKLGAILSPLPLKFMCLLLKNDLKGTDIFKLG